MDGIVVAPAIAVLDIQNCFDSTYSESSLSPIDQFIENTNKINVIFASLSSIDAVKANLVVLGYMSAVESYVRTVVRRVVNIDEYAQKLSESQSVTFGAALHHSDEMMPEALLEFKSFAGEKGISDVIRTVVGIKGHHPPEFLIPLKEYVRICELRHCLVHRFGKLGTKNAIALNLRDHNLNIEKPITLSLVQVNDIAEILRTFVKSFNNHIYLSLLKRTVSNTNDDTGVRMYSEDWTWDLRKDRKRFLEYYSAFCCTRISPPSPELRDCYNQFRKKYRS